MIKETTSTRSSQEDDFVRLEEDMERNEPINPLDGQKEDEYDEDNEPPLISSVFAVDQLKQGAATAAAFFSWGLGAVKEKAANIAESEPVQKALESTKPQREAVSATAATFWEGTRPQREELSKTASTLGEKMQPHLEKLKTESTKALDTISTSVNELVNGPSQTSNLQSPASTSDTV